jgi:hypothetical protein
LGGAAAGYGWSELYRLRKSGNDQSNDNWWNKILTLKRLTGYLEPTPPPQLDVNDVNDDMVR